MLAATLDGTLTARHDTVPCASWQVSGDGNSLLGVSLAGVALFVCPAAAGMQTIDLGSTAGEVRRIPSRVSSRGGRAIVTCCYHHHPKLLFVDLSGLRVVHRQALPAGCLNIAQGSRSAALWDYTSPCMSGQIPVLATGTGAEAGRQLFVVPRGNHGHVAWDALGRHLAVVSVDRVVSVYDGLSGAVLASWSTLGLPWRCDGGSAACAGCRTVPGSCVWCRPAQRGATRCHACCSGLQALRSVACDIDASRCVVPLLAAAEVRGQTLRAEQLLLISGFMSTRASLDHGQLASCGRIAV